MKISRISILAIALLSLCAVPAINAQGHSGKSDKHVSQGQGNAHRSDRGLDRESYKARVHQSPRSVHVRSVPPGHRGLKLGHYKEHGRGRKLGHYKNRPHRRVIVRRVRHHRGH